jgi:putative membrane protein
MGEGGIGMIFFWIFLIVLIVVLVKWLISQSSERVEKSDDLLDILKRPYAKGEIDKTEFEEKVKDLET